MTEREQGLFLYGYMLGTEGMIAGIEIFSKAGLQDYAIRTMRQLQLAIDAGNVKSVIALVKPEIDPMLERFFAAISSPEIKE